MEGRLFSEHECRLARLALQNRYLSRTQIQTCITYRRESGPAMTLEDILIEHCYLTPEEIDELSKLVSAEASADGSMTRLFARIVNRRGLATEQQIDEALRLKRALAARRIRRPLGQILVERGVLSLGQVAEVLAEQDRAREILSRERQRFKAYVPQEMLGRGPLGTVCRARHPEHGEVALKVIPAGKAHPNAVERLRQLSTLEHPNMARVIEAGSTGAGLFVASEFVDGVPLLDHVVGSIRLPLAEAARLLRGAAAALDAAHARAMAHGDLKPENVLVTDRREARLVDFGLGPDGAGPGEDLRACRALWQFMLTGDPADGNVPPLRFESARSLMEDLERIEKEDPVPASK